MEILTKLFQTVTHHNKLSVSIGRHDLINVCSLSRLISKKGDFTPVLANHKKGILSLKTAFLGETQQSVRRLFNQISSFRLETNYVQLTFMLNYRIHGFYLWNCQLGKCFRVMFFKWVLREQHWKHRTRNISKAALASFSPS